MKTPNTRNRSPDHRKRLLQVAYLYSQGIAQNLIAKFFDWGNPPLITQLLNEARRLHLVEDAPEFKFAKCTPRERAELRILDLVGVLRPALRLLAARAGVDEKNAVRAIHVLPSGGTGTTPGMIKRRVEYFATGVAPLLLARILKSQACGVTWGFTLASAIAEIDAIDHLALQGGRRLFVAICGEPYSMEPYFASSSRIAEQLATMHGDPRRASTLRGLPAFIPKGYEHSEIISRFVHEHTAYGRIFGPRPEDRPNAIISKLDTILSSAGVFTPPLSTFVAELVNKSGLTVEQLDALSPGDIGGVLLERPGLTAEQQAEFKRVLAMWIGVKAADLKAVVERAGKERKPGLLLLAIGANKADIVYAAAQRGLVNELFVDQDLALALQTKLRAEIEECAKEFPQAVKKRNR